MGGIINIVLKQGADLGTSGGFTLGAATGEKYNAAGNLGWQRGKLSLFGTYGFNRDHREMEGSSNQLNRSASTWLLQDVNGDQSMQGHNATGNAEYKLSPATSLATNLMYSHRHADREQDNLFHQLSSSAQQTDLYRDLNEGGMHGQTYDAALSLKHAFTPQKNDVSVEGRLTHDEDQALDRFTRDLLDGSTQPGITRNLQDMAARTLTGQLDWTRTFAARTKLEAGYKGTFRHIDNDYRAELFSYGAGDWQDRPGQSNAFQYDERVNAAYAVLSHSVGKVDLQAGLRAEHAGTRFDLATTGQTYDNAYNSLFPSALAAYNLTPARQVKASYSRRVQRPDTRMLNPFLFYQDPQHAWQGNPYLKPEYTDAFELGFQQSGHLGSVQVTPFYRHSTNAIRPIQSIDSTGFSTTKAQNFATANQYGADVNGSLRLGQAVQAFGGFSVFKMNVDATNVGSGLATNTLTWSARGNATWKLDARTDVQAFVMYRAPMKAVTGRFGAFSMSNFSIRRKLDADHSTLSLRLSDPFDQMGFRLTTTSDAYFQETRNKFGARAAYLTCSYSFGHAPRIRAPRPDGNGGDADPRTGPGGPG
jgi:outer membrane receptor protein involved in Fe transport